MKKYLAILIAVFAICLSAASAQASGGSSGGGSGGSQTGSIIDFVGLASAGCGGGAGGMDGSSGTCSEDPQSGLFNSIACRVMKSFNEGVGPVYCNLVQNPNYLIAIDSAMMLYVVLLGFTFLFGMTPMTTGNLISRLLRAVIVYAFTVNADLFFGLIYNTVLRTPQDVVQILLASNTGSGSGAGGAGGGSSNFFEYVDQAMYKVMHEVFYQQSPTDSGATTAKANLKMFMIGMALWQLGGDLVGGLFFTVAIGWIVAYFGIMVRYLLALLSLMFVLMLGPIFIPTLLFEQSKYLGEEWIYMMLNFIMQIVLVVAFVLMVQGFFIDFYDLMKQGLQQAGFTEAPDKSLVTFNNQSTGAAGGAQRLETRYHKTGITPQTADKIFSQSFNGSYQQVMPELVFKLLVMLIIVLCSMAFLKYVPSLAALLVSRPRFVRIFHGEQFGARDRTHQADLLGQHQKGHVDKMNVNSIIDQMRSN